MNYHIWTAGCQMNVADSHRVASALEALGYRSTQQIEKADVIVLNTCVVRQSAEDKAHGWLTSLKPMKDRRPEMVINLMGCLVGVKGNPKLQEAYPHVDVFSPPSDPSPLVDHLLGSAGRTLQVQETQIRHSVMDGVHPLPRRGDGDWISAYVPIVFGCSHACTFCVIPFRRGPEHSRQVGEIASEVRSLAEHGVREVTLLGQIVDRYGLDVPDGPDLSDLLRVIHEIDGIDRIRFLTSHPNWMTDQLLNTIAELPRVCEHIEVPVQAGDDEILKLMKRGYQVEDYRKLIRKIREKLPHGSIGTDIIVGFPGERQEQFQRTYDLLEELRLDVAHLARFSPRPSTVAARKMIDDVPEEEKMERFRTLEELQAKIAGEINQGFQGQEVEVLVEEKHKGRWKGRTRTNKLVFFEAEANLLGKLVQVTIDWAGPWSMQGHLSNSSATEARLQEVAAA